LIVLSTGYRPENRPAGQTEHCKKIDQGSDATTDNKKQAEQHRVSTITIYKVIDDHPAQERHVRNEEHRRGKGRYVQIPAELITKAGDR
jgi:hypothetical protein